MTTPLSIISSIKLKLFILVLTFLALGADSVNAVCTGQYKCRPYDQSSETCENSGWSGHACEGSSQNACNNYVFNCPGGCDAQDDCAWSTSGGSSPTNTPAPTSGGGGGGGGGGGCTGGNDQVTIQVIGDAGSVAPNTAPSNSCVRKEFTRAEAEVSGCSFFWSCNGTSGSWGTLMMCNDKSCPIRIEGVDNKYTGCTASGGGADASFSNGNCIIASKNWNNGTTVNINLTKPASASPTPSQCAVPGVTSTSRNCSGNGQEITVNWNDTGCQQYRVQYSTVQGGNWANWDVANYLQTTINGLNRDWNYKFRVACKQSNLCTPVMSGTYYTYGTERTQSSCSSVPAPTCDFSSGTTSINMGSSGNFTATSNNAGTINMQYREGTSGTWQAIGTNQQGSNPSQTTAFSCYSNNGTYGNMSGKSYQIKCNAWQNTSFGGSVCYGGPGTSGGTGYTDCGSDDYRTVTCTSGPSPTPGVCAAPTNVNVVRTCNGTNSSDSMGWNAVNSCTWYQITWGSDNTPSDWPSGNSFSTQATSKTFTGVNGANQQCYRVKCTNATACNATGVQSSIVCKNACTAASPTPSSSTCGGSIPANAQAHDAEEDDPPISSGTNWTYRQNDNTTKCQFRCSNNYTWDGNSCEPEPTNTPVPGTCGGSVPTGAVRHDAEEETQPIPSGTNWTYRASDNGTKCQYTCDTGYAWDGNSCEPDVNFMTCGQSCNTTTQLCDTNLGLTCRNSICRNASCTNAQQNSSCVCQGAPTNTPAPPSACSSPSGLSCGGSCNASGDMVVNCSWTRDTRVSGFRFTYDDDNGFGNDATNVNLTTSGTTANATYTMSSALPNVQHWFRVSNRVDDGTCDAQTSQTSNVSNTGPATCSTYTCTGTRPANSSIHDGDEPPSGGNLGWAYSETDTNRQCQYYCSTGYAWDGNSCEPDVNFMTCGQSCNTTTQLCDTNLGLTCRNSICRNASCTNAQQNSSCVCQGAPTNTPAPPSACSSPSGLSCGGSCNASGDMVVNCSWTRDTRVSGFRFTYDDDNGFGNDATNVQLTTSGTTANATYTMSSALPNVQHWFRVSNRVDDGTCDAQTSQTSNVSNTGPATCSTYTCTGTRPAQSSIHPNDEPPTNSNLAWRHALNDNNRQCEFYCNAGYTYNDQTVACESASYTCGGTRPANTLYYSGDNAPTSSGNNWVYAASNTTAKCEFFCDAGYTWNSATSTCQLPANSCVAPSITSGSITCASGGTLTGAWNSVNGAASYHYQRNTAASVTGAVQATINGTSFSVPIDEPDVTNYFRVRVQTVTASATCTDPGAWTAWRTVNANSNCGAATPTPEPDPTDEPATCVRPNGLNDNSSCDVSTSMGSLNVNWNKMPLSLNGYSYQLSRANNWDSVNRVDSGSISQPLGTTEPEFAFDYPDPNPPTLYFRVRSQCDTGIQSGWTQWRVINFTPPACGGPTPTPPSYSVNVNLRLTDDNNCSTSDPILSGALDGRMRIDPPDPTPIYHEPVANNGTQTIAGLSGINSIRPVWGDFNDDDDPAYARATNCGSNNPAVGHTVSAASTLNFYFTEVSGPWWQSSFGDVYGVQLDSQIPMSTSHLSVSGNGNDAGAAIWGSSIDLGSVREADASEIGYRDQETINALQNYNHFNSTLSASSVTSFMQTNDGTYKVSGHASVDAPWTITSKISTPTNKKVTVIVPGNLTINENIYVENGSFLFLVVGGDITIAHNVSEINGIFLADGNVTIESGRNQTPPSDDVEFRAQGSVISFGNIVSLRSLPGSDNSAGPATEFIYRPDLIVNTPDNLRSKSTVWQEVAP